MQNSRKKKPSYVTKVISETKQLYIFGTMTKCSADLPPEELEPLQLPLGETDEISEKPDILQARNKKR